MYAYKSVCIILTALLFVATSRGQDMNVRNYPVYESDKIEGTSQSLEELLLSHESGFYTDEFYLSIEHSDPDVAIYYTTDGSEPTDESLLYIEPIRIFNRTEEENQISSIPTASGIYWSEPDGLVNKATVIRARAFKQGGGMSATETKTYLIEELGSARYTLPVISLSTDQEHFFSDEYGIYVYGNKQGNFRERGREWERPVHIEMFDNNGSPFLSQDAGVRIHGGASRSYGQKSLRLYARSEYGENRFNHQLFTDQPYEAYNRLLLRNSGNDWHTSTTMFRDALAQSLIQDLNVETQAYRPFIVFINGEYWGIHNLRERYDRHYLARVYGIDSENIDLLTRQNEVKEGDNTAYNHMVKFIEEHDLADQSNFNKVSRMIDLDNFLNYYSAQIYFGNRDWPHNNIDFWRLRVPYDSTAAMGHDGRWRWLLYDVDYAMGLHSSEFNMIEWLTRDSSWATTIIRNLLENEQFKNQFINRVVTHLNLTFDPHRVVHYIDSLGKAVEPEMREHILRWNRPKSFEDWEANVDAMREFAVHRPKDVRRHMMDYFHAKKEGHLLVDISEPSAGSIQVDNLEITQGILGPNSNLWPWTGIYFEDIPVTLNAEANPGYAFSHWEGNASDKKTSEITVHVSDSTMLKAVFIEEEQKPFPKPFALQDTAYVFSQWMADETPAAYPENMAFVYMDEQDPGLGANIEGYTEGAYNLESRTRINGLGDNGFAFINTGNDSGNPGYPGTRLGGAILSLDTQGVDDIEILWRGTTVLPNSRVYNVRLQYRLGEEDKFKDVLDKNGDPVEYARNNTKGHSEWVGPVALPETMIGKPYVQLLWRYYYTGVRIDPESGQRTKIAISDIQITGAQEDDFDIADTFVLEQNYPNPFNHSTVIAYELQDDSEVQLEVYDVIGRNLATLVDGYVLAGRHKVNFNSGRLASGMYIYSLRSNGLILSRQMMVIK